MSCFECCICFCNIASWDKFYLSTTVHSEFFSRFYVLMLSALNVFVFWPRFLEHFFLFFFTTVSKYLFLSVVIQTKYNIQSMTSLSQVNFYLNEIDMTFVDIDQVDNLKSVDMANLVALFECSASILNHHTTCLLLDQQLSILNSFLDFTF
jgi:hypothetical protein